MRLLVLGGTDFVGRLTAQEAVAQGWDVTVFNRGTREPPPGVRSLLGEREGPGGLDALADGVWDAVIDTWKGAPRAVLASARLLAHRVPRYVYVSSRSVHPLPLPPHSDESAPVVVGAADAEEGDYASNKRGGELAVEAVYGARALHLRAGLVLGPRENAGRLPWWLRRIARGGTVPAPGPYDLPLQYVDARDLASWALEAVRRELTGPYSLVSPPGHTTMGELLDTCVEVTGSDAELVWLTPQEVARAELEPWEALPIYLPPGGLHDSVHRADVSKALAAGLRCRPAAETVVDTWSWLSANPRWRMAHPRPTFGLRGQDESRALRVHRER